MSTSSRARGDGLYDGAPSRWVPVAERELYAEKLRTFLADGVWSATAGGVEAPVAATVADTATDTVAESEAPVAATVADTATDTVAESKE